MSVDPTEDEQYRRTLSAITNKPAPGEHVSDGSAWEDDDPYADDAYDTTDHWQYDSDPDIDGGEQGTEQGTRHQGTGQGTHGTREAEIHYLPSSEVGNGAGNAMERADGNADRPLNRAVPFPGPVGTELPSDETGWHFRSAGAFLSSVKDVVPLWGDRDTPLWQKGESLMLVGPPGVGKSTLAHHIILAGLRGGGIVLGRQVAPIEGRVIYLAMDRPQQIARAFQRLVTEEDMPVLEERMIFHAGPLKKSPQKDPFFLAKMARHFGATMIVVDSMKDIMSSPSDEEAANAYNMARQKCLADGVEWIELHHNRKSNGDNKAPKALDDVYGNRFLTAGAGSIFSLWGESGAERLHLTHIRQPGNGLRPTWIKLTKNTGAMEVEGGQVTLDELLHLPNGVTTTEVAARLYGSKEKVAAARQALKRHPHAYPTETPQERGKPVTVWRWGTLVQPELGDGDE